MSSLRNKIIRLAAAKPELRADLLPLLKEDADPASHDQNRPESYYGLPPRGVQASRSRTAGKVSVRFDHGLTVEDIEGMSPLGRIGQVAHLNTSRSGAKPTRAAIEFARSNAAMLNAMTSGDQAIAAIQSHVYKVTGKSLTWQYIQLPM